MKYGSTIPLLRFSNTPCPASTVARWTKSIFSIREPSKTARASLCAVLYLLNTFAVGLF